MKKIRDQSECVNIYNDGLVVFLYDKSNGKAIEKSSPTILEGFSDDDARDPKLGELAAKGLLVAYELEQDDELSIEVAIGSPLTEAELQKGRWHPVQKAFINIPLGKLCIEGYCNLQISPDYDPDEEPGAVLKVPKDDYVLSLYRIDWDALERDGLWDDSEEWGGPLQVIVLTPVSEAENVLGAASMLRFQFEG